MKQKPRLWGFKMTVEYTVTVQEIAPEVEDAEFEVLPEKETPKLEQGRGPEDTILRDVRE